MLIPVGQRNRPAIQLVPEWITVHDTANQSIGADAVAHDSYLQSADAMNIPVSWHFTVDDVRIVQHIPLYEVAWHAGDGHDGPGNRKSISIEICENADGDRAKAEQHAIHLIAQLLRDYDLGIDSVVPHKNWTGKNCPHLILPRWDSFIAQIQECLDSCPPLGYEFVTGDATTVTHTTEEQPLYNQAFVSDQDFEDYGSMSLDDIRAFLVKWDSCLQGQIEDTDGQRFEPAQVIYKAAQTYHISPMVLLVTMEKEQRSVTSTHLSVNARSWLMGAGSPSTARDQIMYAARLFRSYFDDLDEKGTTVSGWKVGISKLTQDGVEITPVNRSVAALFTYTPYAGAQWGGNQPQWGGNYLFYDIWHNKFRFEAVSTDMSIVEPSMPAPIVGSSPSRLVFNAVQNGDNPPNQTLSIWNAGEGSLEWEVTNAAMWLNTNVASGTSTAEMAMLSVSTDITGMEAGSYDDAIIVFASAAANTTRTVPVSLVISAPPTTLELPDLTVTSVKAPSEIQAGNSVSPSFTIENQGSIASGPFHCTIALSLQSGPYGTDVYLADVTIDSIAGHDSRELAFDVTIPELIPSVGDYYVTVFADRLQRLSESNENNNIGSSHPETIAVASGIPTIAELITDNAIDEIPVTVDGQYYFIFTLENRIDPSTLGIMPASGTTTVYVDGQNCPVSDPNVARKIGLIDHVRKSVYQVRDEFPEQIEEINKVLAGAEIINSVEAITDRIMDLTDIQDYIKYTLFSAAIAPIVLEIQDPMERLKDLATEDLENALEKYWRVLASVQTENVFTDYETAHVFLGDTLWAVSYKEIGIQLELDIYAKWEDTLGVIADYMLQAVVPFHLDELILKLPILEEAAATFEQAHTDRLKAARTLIDYKLNH